MDSIKIMMDEHENILRMNALIRKSCEGIIEGMDVDVADFRKKIDFVRNYADKHHHGKEEQILFVEMQERLGRVGENLITHGMLVEHDLGRLHIMELEKALDEYEKEPTTSATLDIVANAIAYTGLLERHIAKENDVVYPYAQKNLPSEVMDDVNRRTEEFQKKDDADGVSQKYLSMLKAMEGKSK